MARIAEVDEMVKKESAEILNRSDPVSFGSGITLFRIRIPLSGSVADPERFISNTAHFLLWSVLKLAEFFQIFTSKMKKVESGTIIRYP